MERRSVQWGLGENRASDKPGPPIATVTPPNEATSDEQTPHRRKRRRILPKGKLIFAALALLPLDLLAVAIDVGLIAVDLLLLLVIGILLALHLIADQSACA